MHLQLKKMKVEFLAQNVVMLVSHFKILAILTKTVGTAEI